MRKPGARYSSDKNPRCNVCRKKLPPGATLRCPTHPPQYSRDYSAFLTAPIPDGGATHAEIAVVMGITAERVRQIEATALRKLAQNARALALFRGD
jgi:hypothetical protein